MSLFGSSRKKTRAERVRKLKSQVKKLEKAKHLKTEEANLRKKLETLRRHA